MSSAFVRDTDVDPSDELLPDRPTSGHPNLVTERGLELIEQSAQTARQNYAEAVASGDRAEIAKAAREVRYWSLRQASAQLVKPTNDHSHVRFGCCVIIVRDDGRKQTFQIVGEDEADVSAGKISHVSPLARALFGKEVGDVVQVGEGAAEIASIS
jgi:transcription elongation GreA/GreB family factor